MQAHDVTFQLTLEYMPNPPSTNFNYKSLRVNFEVNFCNYHSCNQVVKLIL